MSKPLRPIIGVDYGKARIGVAVSDPMQSFAFGHKTIFRKQTSEAEAIREIAALARDRDADTIVVGLPNRTDGKVSEMAESVRGFAAALAEASGCSIVFEDERYTSKIAQGSLLDAGVRGRKVRDVIDQRAAEIILQSYLDRNRLRNGL